ncbi:MULTISPECIES: DUF5995 family protein [unclassified Streptomyces]|uniref:DUF5995 family protein n=1 Tax=unclassified Streptomyces TaxID=2593676 RepID=UPI002DD96DCD|nr:DUF5995 family protein [Streptomyces sp. NBC_01788]WSB25737.1 DUF5995 family protein [Streptomyces sp. NBC_01788]
MGQSVQPAQGGPGTGDAVDATVVRMRDLAAALPERDGIAVFHRVYLAVTEAARRWPATTLDAPLAGRYLAAVDTAADTRRTPACWRPVLQFRRHPGVRPAQFALAGLHAHIGHDLALAVVDACRAARCEPADLESEFDRVGDFLLALEERVREDLTPGPELLRITDPLTHLLGSWDLERAREASWSAARALWALRRLPDVAEEFARRLDAAVGFDCRMMLTPLSG